ncbi:Glyoxalase/Bleomycin resistance protein/Dihydroxybiphenyl dioxygenase [Leptodontidium sp. MPI-SDFR-AT-0119]|nr:Glyoxalase/Bleomycin resistance protein/Dihydroxybiphenyl dioxygenase [Leptodontidium sp. MPI-SDFR-AT-0119]
MTSADKVQPMPPAHLVHVVLRTNKFKTMVQYYKDFLGAHSSYENERLAFLQYDYEHHRIAIINLPDDAPVPAAGSVGMDHVAFSYESLDHLALTYRQRKALGFLPTKCLNHGPTTSMYYTDPDGNRIEVQVDNYKTAEEASAFMAGPEFARNPIGANFDPEEFCRRVESGEDHESIKKRVEVGARNIGDP